MNTTIKFLLKGCIPVLALLATPALCPAEDLAPGKNYQTVRDLTNQILNSAKVDSKTKKKVETASAELNRQFHLFYDRANKDYAQLEQATPTDAKGEVAARLKKERDDLDDFDSSYQVQNYLSLCKGILKGHFNKSHAYRRLDAIARGGTGKP